ncbi:phage tail protein [Pseudocitrobacter faecalis]|uniref:phage tail fiber protein n=1 Tax=Pseudocitrobacter faecalis TaxID=1398493 RepID=UPI003BA0699F
MIYNTGTISINGNTATGTGTNWTAAASQIRVSQTIIVLSNPVQMFQITAINSGTSLTVTPAASPALSGQKYGILVTDSLSVDGLAQSMSQLINEYDENIGAWETFASTSANQLVTVTINGTSLSIPAIGGLARKGANSDITELKGLTTALSIAQGGTGAKTAADARTNLGLGSSATRNAYSTSGDILSVSDFGIGCTVNNPIPLAGTGVLQEHYSTGFFRQNGTSGYGLFAGIGGGTHYNLGSVASVMSYVNYTRNTMQVAKNVAGDIYVYEMYGTGNTTKSSDGTLKAASPVARIIHSQEECQRSDIDEPGFEWCGCGTANAEAEGINVLRQDTGVYLLSGAAGLASEGWQLLAPMDPGGMGELGVVEAEETESGNIIIRLYRRKYMLSDEGEIVKIKGEPIDVPPNSWIDVRLDMPEDSIFNQKSLRISQV